MDDLVKTAQRFRLAQNIEECYMRRMGRLACSSLCWNPLKSLHRTKLSIGMDNK